MKRILGLQLWQKVLLGLVLGAIVGYVLQDYADPLKLLGTIFINLIKMVVVPLIFFSLVTGITSMGDSKNFKRVGLKAVFAFLATSMFAVLIGIATGLIIQPGVGLDISQLSAGASNDFSAAENVNIIEPTLSGILLGMIPTNVIRAMSEDRMLQVVFFAIFTGVSLNLMRDRCKKVIEVIHEMAQVTFKMIEIIVQLAPYGVFGLTAWMVGTQGFDVVGALAKLVGAVLLAVVIQYVFFGALIAVVTRLSPMPFYKKMLEVQSLAFSTSSSKATLTTAMRILRERMGVSRASTEFTLPLGASINMDGTAIYLGLGALFFAQASGITLSPQDYFILILTSTIGSIGAAGIPSGSLIFMGMVLTSVGIPIEGIGIIAGVDRILDMIRTTINITGDAAITLIVDKSEGTLKEDVYYS